MAVNTVPKYRPDIDGLRGIAVLFVLVFHAFPGNLTGGFIGVDVFFVVSGYLISSIIIASLSRGRFSFIEFYTRRIRRILPALVVVLLATYTVGWFVLLPDEYSRLGKHVAGAAFFVPNILLWRESGYFDTAAELKPLLHLWSLGIEEQFYLFWPTLLYLTWRRKWNLPFVISLLLAWSFTANALLISVKPVATFYMPFTRLWELSTGALIAWHDLRNRETRVAASAAANNMREQLMINARSVAGLVLVFAPAVMFDRTTVFPGYWALLPVVGTALLIPKSQCASWINANVLSLPIIVWVGLISYPLYLWHWPLLSLARIVDSQTPRLAIRGLASIGSLVLAWLTFTCIELPLKKWNNRTFTLACLPPLLLVIGAAGFATYREGGIPSRFSTSYDEYRETPLPNIEECQKRYPFARDSQCGLSSVAAPPSVMILGDSHARSLFLGLSEYFARRGKAVVEFGMGGCPPFIGVERQIGDRILDCDHVTQNALAFLERTPAIDTVILIGNFSAYTGSLQDTSNSPTTAFRAGLDAVLTRLERTGRRIILLHQVPRLDIDPKLCGPRPFRLTSGQACRVSRQFVNQYFTIYKALASGVLDRHRRVMQVDPTTIFCDSEWCYASIDGQILYCDEHHLNRYGSEYFASKVNLDVSPPPTTAARHSLFPGPR
jgi:peptidoglycan/LPS O-acetylase OafA/YrhL